MLISSFSNVASLNVYFWMESKSFTLKHTAHIIIEYNHSLLNLRNALSHYRDFDFISVNHADLVLKPT